VVTLSVTDHGEQDVDTSPSQGEHSLLVLFLLGPLAFAEVSGLRAAADADLRGGVEDALEPSVIAAGPVKGGH
jgi:hypothetical protein